MIHVSKWRENVIIERKSEQRPRGRLVNGLDFERRVRSPERLEIDEHSL